MTRVFQIKVGKHQTGIIGFEAVLKEMAIESQGCSDQEIAARMLEKLSKINYIPSTVTPLYELAFVLEYKKFMGEPISEIPVQGVEIKVLGAGCPTCDRLEQDLMALLEEEGVQADLEHIRDIQKISQYGVMGSPALVINGRVKAVGTVPSKARLKTFIREAQADLNQPSSQ